MLSVFRLCVWLCVAVMMATPSFSIAAFAQNRDRANEIKSDIKTLYARDPLAQMFCFTDGEYGSVLQEGEVRNRCSHISFGSYKEGNFTVGVQGGQRGVIVDLGTPQELQRKYGYEETVSRGQGFASIRVHDGKVLIAQNRQAKTSQELKEAAALYQLSPSSSSSAFVKLGHIYIMRLTDSNDKDFDLIVKLIVIAHTPDETVTIRWQIL